MSPGTFYGVGVGPGDPELLTLKAVEIISRSKFIFVPKARGATESLVLRIVESCLPPGAKIELLEFPVVRDRQNVQSRWNDSFIPVVNVLRSGNDACYLTLGDPYIYSTYIYLVRAIQRCVEEINIVTIPGITAFNAAAALTEFSLAEADESITLVPGSIPAETANEFSSLPGTMIVMKIGDKMARVNNDILIRENIDRVAFVSRAGLSGQEIRLGSGETLDDRPQANMTVILTRFKPRGPE
ncbi:MAG: precorrin-2 C(20)-methyltransferase [Deltaproteobacteria bacterium]|nr:precorrin-2 C(20)-methyltransferase [Deltaproteobacteria bacterium]